MCYTFVSDNGTNLGRADKLWLQRKWSKKLKKPLLPLTSIGSSFPQEVLILEKSGRQQWRAWGGTRFQRIDSRTFLNRGAPFWITRRKYRRQCKAMERWSFEYSTQLQQREWCDLGNGNFSVPDITQNYHGVPYDDQMYYGSFLVKDLSLAVWSILYESGTIILLPLK